MNAVCVNRLRDLQRFGQRVWLDELRRSLLRGKTLEHLIRNDGISGVTTNPAIFQRAFSEDGTYKADINHQQLEGHSTSQIYESLAIQDVQNSADLLRRTYRNTSGDDGYVSLEVAPSLAHDAAGTLTEARRLWNLLDRPNAMIKVPATTQGLLGIRQLLEEGINVNATLIFGESRYREVVDAFLCALETRTQAGLPIRNVISVASLFVSRLDDHVDSKLQQILQRRDDANANALLGTAGVGVAKLAYSHFKSWRSTRRWAALQTQGAHPQRLLWASTSTKSPSYRDVKYLEELIASDTITTVPIATLEAFRDHGRVTPMLEKDSERVMTLCSDLQALEIDLDTVASELEAQGLEKFLSSHQAVLSTISLLGSRQPRQSA